MVKHRLPGHVGTETTLSASWDDIGRVADTVKGSLGRTTREVTVKGVCDVGGEYWSFCFTWSGLSHNWEVIFVAVFWESISC